MPPLKGQIVKKPRFSLEKHASAVITLNLIDRNLQSLQKDIVADYSTASAVRAQVDSAARRVVKLRKALDADFLERFPAQEVATDGSLKLSAWQISPYASADVPPVVSIPQLQVVASGNEAS